MNCNWFQNLDKQLRVFRDDQYPYFGGGNKGRKMQFIAKNILAKNANALVTTGGIHSNHCRAVALFAAQYKMQCTLVLHGSKERFENESGNAMLMRLSGSKIIFVDHPSEIGPTMDQAMEEYKANAFSPYYIWGGGHNLEGGLAYIYAVEELKQYCEKENWIPDYIFHASGTGSTQAGILAGLDKYQLSNTEVIGISVGRKSEQASKIVADFYKDLCEKYEIDYSAKSSIVLDDYLMGGYACFNKELKELSLDSIKNYGFPLDTCYSGKAFYGMLDYIKIHQLEHKNILFWHTGGVLNFLAE